MIEFITPILILILCALVIAKCAGKLKLFGSKNSYIYFFFTTFTLIILSLGVEESLRALALSIPTFILVVKLMSNYKLFQISTLALALLIILSNILNVVQLSNMLGVIMYLLIIFLISKGVLYESD